MSNIDFTLGLHQEFYNKLGECAMDAEALDFPEVELLYFNPALAQSFDANFPEQEAELAQLFAGQMLPMDAKPIAQAYAGHQFGQFNPQLGDGRAMVLGELADHNKRLYELDLKGSGPTPFSRGGDGQAALGPMLREVLISEAMAALNVPTTRSLAVVTTGKTVHRDPPQRGAVLARTSASQIRIGTFQFFAARNQYDVVEKLIDFCIERHFPHISGQANKALSLLEAAIEAQAELIAKWMGLGFIHGVMNTDNMLISGETIDYGPCAFMDTYDPKTVFSSIDRNSRYAYMNQAGVTQWNLSRFAETLLPLIARDLNVEQSVDLDDDGRKEQAITLATNAIQEFDGRYTQTFRALMCAKLGLHIKQNNEHLKSIDKQIEQWHDILFTQKLDWTLAHLYLTTYVKGEDEQALLKLCQEPDIMKAWLIERQQINVSATDTSNTQMLEAMQSHNPAVIPRNHLVEQALELAHSKGDLSAFEDLLAQLQKPFELPEDKRYLYPASAEFNEDFMTFCGT